MANESIKPFPRGRLEQELDSIPSSTEGVPALLEAEQPYEDYEINLYGKRYRVPSPPKNIAKTTPKPDYSKINVYEAVSVMEVSKALPELAGVLMGMRNLKQGNQEFSMDANGYLHYLDTRLYESNSKLGNADNAEEAIALAEEWIGGIRKAWPSARSSFLTLKTFPEPFPSQYLGKPTAAAIASSDGREILFWRVIYPIELKPSQWEDAAPLLGCSIELCIKGQGNEAILGGMDYNWRGVKKTDSETRFNIFVETEKGKVPVQQAQTPPSNATASASDMVIIPKPQIKQMVYEGDKGDTVRGIGWNGVEGSHMVNLFYTGQDKYAPQFIAVSENKKSVIAATKVRFKAEEFDTKPLEGNLSFQFSRNASETEKKHLMTMSDYIYMVKTIEDLFTEEKKKQTKFIVTQFRRSFSQYNSANWNGLLIKNTDELELPSTYQAFIKDNKEVVLNDGKVIDIGHLFTGLDAAFHTHPVDDYEIYASIKRNIDAVTWLGDVGSVIGELYWNRIEKSKLTLNLQELINDNCSSEDLLADIDSLAIAQTILQSFKRLSVFRFL